MHPAQYRAFPYLRHPFHHSLTLQGADYPCSLEDSHLVRPHAGHFFVRYLAVWPLDRAFWLDMRTTASQGTTPVLAILLHQPKADTQSPALGPGLG
jgi:hypothetical protein